MRLKNVKLLFDIDPIVKLSCYCFECTNNTSDGYCNLKNITIDPYGKCKELAIGKKEKEDEI